MYLQEMERAAEVKKRNQARAAEIRQQYQEEAVRTKQRTDRKERSLVRLGEDATNLATSLREELGSIHNAQHKQNQVSFGTFDQTGIVVLVADTLHGVLRFPYKFA